MHGTLIKGLGKATKVFSETGEVSFEYDYPEGTPVTTHLNEDGSTFVRAGDIIIAVFTPNDTQKIWDYVGI